MDTGRVFVAPLRSFYHLDDHNVAVALTVTGRSKRTSQRPDFVTFASHIADAEDRGAAQRLRRWPRTLNVLGIVGCTTLVSSLPLASVVSGLIMFVLGIIGRWLILEHRRRTSTSVGEGQ